MYIDDMRGRFAFIIKMKTKFEMKKHSERDRKKKCHTLCLKRATYHLTIAIITTYYVPSKNAFQSLFIVVVCRLFSILLCTAVVA